MRPLDRRDFLAWALRGAAAAWLASCREEAQAPAARPARDDPRDPAVLASALRRRFDFLDLDEVSLQRFCRDYLRHVGPPALGGRDLYSRFLLSSDFFRNGAHEERLVRYVTFYDPYVSACPNPLARFGT